MRRFVRWGVTVLAVGVAALPALLVPVLGWQHAVLLGDPLGPGSGIVVVMILFYALWLPGTVFGLIWVFDRLGLHYAVASRQPAATVKERRRQRAGLELLASQERARQEAERESASHDRSALGRQPQVAGERSPDRASSSSGERSSQQAPVGPRRQRPSAGTGTDLPDAPRRHEEER